MSTFCLSLECNWIAFGSKRKVLHIHIILEYKIRYIEDGTVICLRLSFGGHINFAMVLSNVTFEIGMEAISSRLCLVDVRMD